MGLPNSTRGRTIPGLLCAAAVILVTHGAQAGPEKVRTISYHDHPPFTTSPSTGLTYDLADLLSARSEGRFLFEVEMMSRPRLNKLIAGPGTHVVPWVDPVWFKDAGETRYTWTGHGILRDGNAVVSTGTRRVVYQGPESFAGLVFGGVRGHYYKEVDPFIEGHPDTRRIDSDRHRSNIGKLEKGLIDVTMMPISAVRYFVAEDGGGSEALFVSPRPHSRFLRRAFVTAGRGDLRDYLDSTFGALPAMPEWRAILAKYGLEPDR